MWPTKSGNPISPFPKNILSSCKKLIVSCQKTAKLQNHSSCNMIAILYSNFDRAAIFCLNFQDFERLIWFCNRSLGKVIKLSRKKTLGHPVFSVQFCAEREGPWEKVKCWWDLLGKYGSFIKTHSLIVGRWRNLISALFINPNQHWVRMRTEQSSNQNPGRI